MLRAVLLALFAELRRRARRHWSLRRGPCGAVPFIQRFGSAVNANLHFHTLALDGVYATDDGVPTRFRPLPPPSTDEVARVLAGTARRIARLLVSGAGGDDVLARDEPLLATLTAASLRARIASGPHAGERWRRLGDRVEPEEADADPEASSRVPQHTGMSLHADVAVPAHDRCRLARLCHHAARPPLASDRLEAQPDGRLALRLETGWRDGTTHILMERHELLERLVPGGHEAKEPGAAAIRASAGARPAGPLLNPGPGASDPSARGASEASPRRDDPVDPAAARRSPRRLPWADFLQRAFATDGLRCECGARMRLVAAIEDPTSRARSSSASTSPPAHRHSHLPRRGRPGMTASSGTGSPRGRSIRRTPTRMLGHGPDPRRKPRPDARRIQPEPRPLGAARAPAVAALPDVESRPAARSRPPPRASAAPPPP